MSQEELDALKKSVEDAKKSINESMDEKIKAATKENVSKETLEGAVKALKDATEKQINTLTNTFDELQKAITEQKQAPKLNVTLKGAIVEAVEAQKEIIDTIVKADGKQTEPLVISIGKAAVDMTVTNTIGAGSTAVSIIDNTGIVTVIRHRLEKYLANVSVGSTTGNRVMWIEETDEQGTPIFIAEGATKIPTSVKYVEQTANVKKIAVYGKITTEMMADAPFLVSYIQNNLVKRVREVTENQLLAGDGVGDNLKGLKTYASAFSAGTLALSIATANEFDVLNAIAVQVESANGVPNCVFIHPVTLAKMKSLKTTTGEPIYKDYQDIHGNLVVNGMFIVTTTGVTAGEFIGGDCTVANVLFRENLKVQIGIDGNDFINNKKTVLVEQRLVQFVSANDTPVIVKGTFSAAITALLKP